MYSQQLKAANIQCFLNSIESQMEAINERKYHSYNLEKVDQLESQKIIQKSVVDRQQGVPITQNNQSQFQEEIQLQKIIPKTPKKRLCFRAPLSEEKQPYKRCKQDVALRSRFMSKIMSFPQSPNETGESLYDCKLNLNSTMNHPQQKLDMSLIKNDKASVSTQLSFDKALEGNFSFEDVSQVTESTLNSSSQDDVSPSAWSWEVLSFQESKISDQDDERIDDVGHRA